MYQDIGIRIQVLGMAQFKRNINEANNAVNSLVGQFNRAVGVGPGLSGMLNNLGNNFVALGTTLTKSVSIPLITMLGTLTTFGISFEQAFTGVTKTVDGLSDEFGNLTPKGEMLRDMIRQMALDMPIAQNEIAKVTQVAGQLGVTGVENLAKFTEEALKLGIATDFSAEEAATSFARLANIVGVKSEDMSKFLKGAGSVAVELGNNFATTEPEILAMALRFAATANAAGLLTPEILAIATAASSMGIQSELGGSTFTRIFSEMTSSVNKYNLSLKGSVEQQRTVNEQIKALQAEIAKGTSFETLKIRFGDILDLSGLEGDLNAVEDGTKTLGEVIDDVRTRSFGQLDAALAASQKEMYQWANIAGLSVDEFRKMYETDPSGLFLKIMKGFQEMSDAGEITTDTLKDLNLGGVRVFDVVSKMGGDGFPVLESAIKTANAEWEDQNALQAEYNKFASTTLSKLKILRNSFYDLGITLFDLVSPALNTVIGGLTKFVTLISKKLRFDDSFQRNIAALVVGLIALGPALTGIGYVLKVIAPLFATFSFLFANPLLLAGLAAIVAAGIAISQNWAGLGDLFGAVTESIGALVSSFLDFEIGLLNANVIFEQFIAAVGRGDWDTALLALRAAWELFIVWFQTEGLPLLKAAWLKIRPMIEDSINQIASAFWTWITEVVIPNVIERLDNLLKEIGTFIKDNAPVLQENLTAWIRAMWEWVEEVFPIWLDKAEGLITDILGWVAENYPRLVEKCLLWGKAFVEWAIDLWNGDNQNEGLKYKLGRFILSTLEWIAEQTGILIRKFATEWVPAFINWAIDLWHGKEGQPGLKRKLQDFLNDLLNWLIFDAPMQIANAALSLGESLINGFVSGITGNSFKIGEALKKALKDLGVPDEVLEALGWKINYGPPNMGPIPPGGGPPPNSGRLASEAINVLADALGSSLGSTVVTSNSNSMNTTNNNQNFAPTINAQSPMSASDLQQLIWNSWQSAQAVG